MIILIQDKNDTPVNQNHIKLLAKESGYSLHYIKERVDDSGHAITVHDALLALDALETDLTEKHRAEVEGLRTEIIEECKDVLLKHLAPVTYNNGYPIQAVAQATILSLPALMKTTNPKEERK